MFLTDRLTRALLGAKRCEDLLYPVSVGPLPRPQAQGKQPLRKDLKEALFRQAGKWSSQDVGKVSLLCRSRSSKLACLCKPVFGRKGLASKMGDLKICSED